MSGYTPIRTCAGCGKKSRRQDLLRIVRTPEGSVRIDARQDQNGRGVYLCRSTACLQKALKRGSLGRGLKGQIPPEIPEMLQKEIENSAAE